MGVTALAIVAPEPWWRSLARRRYGSREGDAALRATMAVCLASLPVVAFVPRAEPFILLFLVALWMRGPLAGLLPVALEPVLMLYGRLYPPGLVALITAAASACAEVISLHLMRGMLESRMLERARGTVQGSRLMRLFQRRPFAAIAFSAATPIPDWIARTLAATSRYSVFRYVVADTAGRLPKLWLTAALGLLIPLSPRVLGTVAVGSIIAATAIAVIKLATRSRRTA